MHAPAATVTPLVKRCRIRQIIVFCAEDITVANQNLSEADTTDALANPATAALADDIEDLLPQTQCTKCGYAACRPYAEAIATGKAGYNQCPPGGVEGVARLARLLGRPVIPINPVNGRERPRPLAVIDEELCIGCTLCMQACPVDAIMGAAKHMHVILPSLCTGCDLCVAPCPVDCISMVPVTPGHTGWDAWSQTQADEARARHDFRLARLRQERLENDARLAAKVSKKRATAMADALGSEAGAAEHERKRGIIAAAIERARLKKLTMESPVSDGSSKEVE
ncbi:MAG: electron transport complex subunit RsxB [Burkholderiaceae bacterium]